MFVLKRSAQVFHRLATKVVKHNKTISSTSNPNYPNWEQKENVETAQSAIALNGLSLLRPRI